MKDIIKFNLERYTTDPTNTELIYIKPLARQSFLNAKSGRLSQQKSIATDLIKENSERLEQISSILKSIHGASIPKTKIEQIIEIIEK